MVVSVGCTTVVPSYLPELTFKFPFKTSFIVKFLVLDIVKINPYLKIFSNPTLWIAFSLDRQLGEIPLSVTERKENRGKV